MWVKISKYPGQMGSLVAKRSGSTLGCRNLRKSFAYNALIKSYLV